MRLKTLLAGPLMIIVGISFLVSGTTSILLSIAIILAGILTTGAIFFGPRLYDKLFNKLSE